MIKEHLKFAGKVVIALVIINLLLGLIPSIKGYVYDPLGALKGGGSTGG